MTDPKTALITGIHGQDGFYLARLLGEKGYRVVGLGRAAGGPSWAPRLGVEYRVAGFGDTASLIRLLRELRPAEVYHLASQSYVPASWECPVGTLEANGLSVIHLLEAIRHTDPATRFFQASSAQMFGRHRDEPCSEQTPFCPANPYAASKLFAHMMTVSYREAHGMFAATGILFNHESPRRPARFVSRRISAGVAAIERGQATELRLGNLDAVRDWGYAGDFVVGMWLSLQAEEASDYVFCTGKSHRVRDFVRLAFEVVGRSWEDHVRSSGSSGSGGDVLLGDPARARARLGWEPGVGFPELVERMVRADLAADD